VLPRATRVSTSVSRADSGSAAPAGGQPAEADELDHFAGIPRLRVEPGEHRDHLGPGEFRLRGELQDDADPGPPVPSGARGILPEHRHRAAVPVAVALKDLHSGGLAGSVRPQQREHFAAADV